ncbi:MAG: hypothetical protein ACR2LU_12520 [Luteitalea sp.]
MSRHLWFGAALLSAFGSIYAGIFGATRIQYVLVGCGVIALALALKSPTPPPPYDPRTPG